MLQCTPEDSIEFYGWTSFNNDKYPDICDEISKYRKWKDNEDGLKNQYYDPPEKQSYCEELSDICGRTESLVAFVCKTKGIRFNGYYHQNGDYGTPLIKTKYGIFKWTCSFRFWGGVMVQANQGEDYKDWAWYDYDKPVTPDMIEGENLIS
jgi:hypothetical protein